MQQQILRQRKINMLLNCGWISCHSWPRKQLKLPEHLIWKSIEQLNVSQINNEIWFLVKLRCFRGYWSHLEINVIDSITMNLFVYVCYLFQLQVSREFSHHLSSWCCTIWRNTCILFSGHTRFIPYEIICGYGFGYETRTQR